MGFKTRRSEAQRGKHGAKKSKHEHSASSSEVADPMDVEHGAPLSVTRSPRRAPNRSRSRPRIIY